MKKNSIVRNQKGFTLIEIIAVLVILGILAAVAIPKFLSLQDDARQKTAEGFVAAGQSAISMAYAKYLLNSNNATGGPAAACSNVAIEGADNHSLNCSGSDWNITNSTINAAYGNQNATGTWTKP